MSVMKSIAFPRSLRWIICRRVPAVCVAVKSRRGQDSAAELNRLVWIRMAARTFAPLRGMRQRPSTATASATS